MMGRMRIGKLRSFHMQQRDVVDVDPMRATLLAFPVADEFAADNADHSAGRTAGEDAGFIVEEATVFDRQIAALRTNAGPVLVRHARPLQGEVADRDVAAGSDQYRLTAAGLVGHDDAGALALDGEVVLADDRAVEILPWIDLDRIAVLRGRHRFARLLELVALTHLEGSSQERECPDAHRHGEQRSCHRHRMLLVSFKPPPHCQLSRCGSINASGRRQPRR